MRKFRARFRARAFTSNLISRLSNVDRYGIKDGGIIFPYSGDIVVRLLPRRFRCLEGVTALYQGADIWLPLLSRLRLRRVVRCVLIEAAHNALCEDD